MRDGLRVGGVDAAIRLDQPLERVGVCRLELAQFPPVEDLLRDLVGHELQHFGTRRIACLRLLGSGEPASFEEHFPELLRRADIKLLTRYLIDAQGGLLDRHLQALRELAQGISVSPDSDSFHLGENRCERLFHLLQNRRLALLLSRSRMTASS